MKKILTHILFLVCTITLSSFVLHSITNTVPDQIVLAISNGNSDDLAEHFNRNIELKLLNKSSIYSRYQAKIVIKNFFLKNVPKEFKVIYKYESEEMIQIYGKLTTTAETTYTVNVYISKIGDQLYITRFKIEK